MKRAPPIKDAKRQPEKPPPFRQGTKPATSELLEKALFILHGRRAVQRSLLVSIGAALHRCKLWTIPMC
jgi:hypothetical protein